MMRDEHVTRIAALAASSAVSNGASPAERLLAAIVDTVREPLLVLDGDLRIMRANRAFLASFHAGSADAVGQPLFALDEGRWDIPAVRALLCERLPAAGELFDADVDHVFPLLGRRILMLNARLVAHEPDGSRITLLAIEDVTQSRLAARRLAAQHRELMRSNTALNEFAFIASHDLQEPLRKILSFGERLDTTAGPRLDGQSRQYLDRLLGAATRMRTLINDLLAYSQAAASIQPFIATDLSAVLRDVVADLETAIAESGAVVEVETLPTIEADATQMRQLFQNLLGNAIKFRRKDTILVARVCAGDVVDGFRTITVEDNGIGIELPYREKVFRMFERLHSRTAFDGSGMGLAICRRIVERHGGTIAAISPTGQGSTFRVALPVTQVDAEHAP